MSAQSGRVGGGNHFIFYVYLKVLSFLRFTIKKIVKCATPPRPSPRPPLAVAACDQWPGERLGPSAVYPFAAESHRHLSMQTNSHYCKIFRRKRLLIGITHSYMWIIIFELKSTIILQKLYSSRLYLPKMEDNQMDNTMTKNNTCQNNIWLSTSTLLNNYLLNYL